MERQCSCRSRCAPGCFQHQRIPSLRHPKTLNPKTLSPRMREDPAPVAGFRPCIRGSSGFLGLDFKVRVYNPKSKTLNSKPLRFDFRVYGLGFFAVGHSEIKSSVSGYSEVSESNIL